MSEEPTKWRIDRHVPLALIFSIISAITVQTIAASWWAAGVSFRISDLEQRMSGSSQNGDRLTRLEAKSEYVIETLKEIKGLLSPPRH